MRPCSLTRSFACSAVSGQLDAYEFRIILGTLGSLLVRLFGGITLDWINDQ